MTWIANYAPDLHELAGGNSERRMAIELSGAARGTSAWQEARPTGLTQGPPVGLSFLNARATNAADRQGGAGAQAVRVLGWRLHEGYYRPLTVEIPLLAQDNVTDTEDWYYPIGATAVGSNAGDIDVSVGAWAADGHLRIPATAGRAYRCSAILPPATTGFVISLAAAMNAPVMGAAGPGVRLAVRHPGNSATVRHIYHAPTLLAPGDQVILEVWGDGASASNVEASAVIRLLRSDTVGRYRQWAGNLEEI